MLPFVLSGGSGTRLWPVSRSDFPKQFCELLEEPLLTATLRRLRPLAGPAGEVGVLGSARTEHLVRRTFAEQGLSDRWAWFEPQGRSTAPAVAILCHRLLQEEQGTEVAGVFPADHRIADEAGFQRAVALAERCAAAGQVATLGIRPSAPDTGFGYVELESEPFAREEAPAAGAEPLRAFPVRSFREKPDPATAQRYFESGRFVWNAGMFVFRVEVMAGHFARLMPELWATIRRVEPDLSNLAEVYAEIEPQSIDHGVMEHLADQVSIPCDIGWSDVGSWDEVARLRESGPYLQVGAGDEPGGAGSFVLPHRDRTYGLVGVDDLLVVDTADALLIARRGTSQAVKELVERLRAAGRPEADRHAFEVRPWGRFEVLRDEADFKSKVIRVDPGRRLSYQSHEHRAEHWVIVRGRAEVTLDGRLLHLGPGDHVFIPRGARHRIANPGEEPVLLVEVQLGSYFGEDDITRYEDDFGRS
ncbi:MAG TPA: mannose-1-phosphate guanylyltransferase/mannose-6-phosphate isomerase [Thermoanaerobaculia bacterium]|nr:mannose-1-phosphate guanylyltransferase/mannose-6-phosphate isomerase [Thermoanaerobaculia bacterium]